MYSLLNEASQAVSRHDFTYEWGSGYISGNLTTELEGEISFMICCPGKIRDMNRMVDLRLLECTDEQKAEYKDPTSVLRKHIVHKMLMKLYI